MRCIKISSVTDATLFSRFPSQLTALHFGRIRNLKLKKENIQSLPRSLKYLEIADFSWDHMQKGDFPQLRRLSFVSRLGKSLTEENIETLPSSLIDFHYNGVSTLLRSLNAMASACPRLEILNVTTKPCIEDESDPLILSLPSNLKSLMLPNVYGDCHEYEDAIKKGFKPFPWTSAPSFLRTLSLDRYRSHIYVSKLIHLPKTLTELQFGHLLNDWEPKRDEIQKEGEKPPLIPPTAYHEHNIFRSLPKELQSLYVGDAIRIFDPVVFQELPKTLTVFRWMTSLPHNRNLLPYLPKGLTDCIIHLDILTNEDIALTPRKLGFFGITAEDTKAITLDAVHLLPPETYTWSLNLRDDLHLARRLDAIQQKMAVEHVVVVN